MIRVFYPERCNNSIISKAISLPIGLPANVKAMSSGTSLFNVSDGICKETKMISSTDKTATQPISFHIHPFSRKQCQIDNVILKTHPSQIQNTNNTLYIQFLCFNSHRPQRHIIYVTKEGKNKIVYVYDVHIRSQEQQNTNRKEAKMKYILSEIATPYKSRNV